jgi:hypothetical protein
MTRFGANCRWASAHDDELQQFVWRYVAIDDERLLDVADTWQELRRKYADRDALYVTKVSPPDMAWMFHGQS